MARLWCEALRIDRVGIHDNFFELGGDSLQAAILLNQLPAAVGRQFSLPLRDVFEARTIATLAGRIEAALQAAGAAGEGPIPRIPRQGELPLSFNQDSLWFLGRLEPDRPSYLLYLALDVKGPVSIPTLERALNEILRRHEILRTRFPEVDGRPVQVIEPHANRSLPVIDLSHLPPREREVELRRKIAEEMGRPIDLENGPLVRIILLRRGEGDYAIAASLHHIIHDGWSVGVVLTELAALYPAFLAGRPSPLPELPIQFVDYAAWQRNWLQGETLERLQSYWRRQLAGVPPLEIPTDFPRPAVRTTRGSSRHCRLPAETSAAVLEFCRREGTTPYMVLLAAFEVLLARYSGQDDFAVATPVANRSRPEFESLIGYLVNVVVLRAGLSGNPSFREAVARVQQVALDAFEHQAISLDQVVHAVRPTRDLSRNPIFQVMFALHNLQLPALPNLSLEIAPLADCPAPPSANFDLTLELFQTEGEFQGSLNFSTDLFDPETIDRMARQYQVLVAAAVREPDGNIAALPLLEEEQQRKMLAQGRGPARDYDRERLPHRLFETQAERQPDAVAVVLGDQRWSYGELNARANQLARYLRCQGVGPEVRVGICLERSPQLVAAVLAVMKAGGGYVPLDPAYTQAAEERFKFVLADAQVSLLLTDSTLSAALDTGPARRIVLDGEVREEIQCEGREDLNAAPSAEHLAYVLYTSGSTGRPKGVMVTQGNLLNAYHGWREAYGLGAEVRSHLQMASFSFDVFEGDLVRALCSGGKLVICRKEILLDPVELLGLMRRESVDIAEFVPIVLRNLVEYLEETGQTLDFMRLVIAGSDAWYAADHRRARRVLGPRTRLVNSYGLTETTIDSSYFEGDVGLSADTALVPIGRPLPNVQLYVLDERMRAAPPGLPGQLYIGGRGVSRGYVNPDLNAERFPPDPFAAAAAARLCRTGDRARWRPDGQLEFLGRADNQVKIRGYRIEPAEVEQVLREHLSVVDAAVVARPRTAGDLRLVAYVVGRSGETPEISELKPFLAERLPDYMIPSAFVPLAALPATSSGKLDRKALPEPDWSQTVAEREFVAPRTATEQQLAAIWCEVLNLDRLGVHDNFFDCGGNSLLSLRLVARVRKQYAVDLPLVTLFTAPTVAELAERIERLQSPVSAVKAAAQDLPKPQPSRPTPDGTVNWNAEIQLDSAIRVTADLRAAAAEPSHVLLTGATGFLGAYLLRELLLRTSADVYCLVRAPNPEEARKKILRNLEQYELRGARSSPRIIPVCGDLAQPRLGLAADEYQRLAEVVDAVYHNGAYVNFVYPYPMLKSINVTGTVEVLRLATHVKVKPVHFVSTLSVFESPDYAPLGRVDERQPLEALASLQSGYAQSKCVAEKLVQTAAARGLPVVVYRPGRVTADSATGAESPADYTTMLFRLCVELGMAPMAGDTVEMTPVDYVARSIVALAQSPESPGRTFHLMNPRPVPLGDIYEAIRSCGYELREVPLDVLRSQAIAFGARSKDESFAAFAHWLTLMTPPESAAGTAPLQPIIVCKETLQLLDQLGVSCPLVDVESLRKLLAFLNRKRALPVPIRAGNSSSDGKNTTTNDGMPRPSDENETAEPWSRQPHSLVPLRREGSGRPLFLIHGLGGYATALVPLARGLAVDCPVYGLQAQGLDASQTPHDSIEAMAAFYLGEIRAVQPKGPYLLGGWSMGGVIALEAARQLGGAGEEVALLAMLDTYLSLADFQKLDLDDQAVLRWIAPRLKLSVAELRKLPLERQWERIEEQAMRSEGIGVAEIHRLAVVCKAHLAALRCYVPQPYPRPVVLFAAGRGGGNPTAPWVSLCPRLRVEPVSGDHYTMLCKPDVELLAERLGRQLREALGGGEMTRNA
jgi:amino acid adenylation domain-containing protein/thioester reductase-like protein